MFGIEDFSQKIVDFANFNPSQLGEALAFGGAVLLIGMLAIFAVLTLLWGCLILFRIVMSGMTKKKSKPVNVDAPINATPTPAVNTPKESEIVAVIAAAIAMAESESNGVKFKVVSFKRK